MGNLASALQPSAFNIFLDGGKNEMFGNFYYSVLIKKDFEKNENVNPKGNMISSSLLLDLYYNYKTLTTAKNDVEFLEKVLIPIFKSSHVFTSSYLIYTNQLFYFEKRILSSFNSFLKDSLDFLNRFEIIENNDDISSKNANFSISSQKDIDNFISSSILSKSDTVKFNNATNKEKCGSRLIFDKIDDISIENNQLIYDLYALSVSCGDLEGAIKSIQFSYNNDNKVKTRKFEKQFISTQKIFRPNPSFDEEKGVFIFDDCDSFLNMKSNAAIIGEKIYYLKKSFKIVVVDISHSNKTKDDRFGTLGLQFRKVFGALYSVGTKLVLVDSDNEMRTLQTYPELADSFENVDTEECEDNYVGGFPMASDGKYIYQLNPKECILSTMTINDDDELKLVRKVDINSKYCHLDEDFVKSYAVCDGSVYSLCLVIAENSFQVQITSFSCFDGSFIGKKIIDTKFPNVGMFYDPYERKYWTLHHIKDALGFTQYQSESFEFPFVYGVNQSIALTSKKMQKKCNKKEIKLSKFAFIASNCIYNTLFKLVGCSAKNIANNFPDEYQLLKNPNIAHSAIKAISSILSKNISNKKLTEEDVFIIESLYMSISVNRTINCGTDETFAARFFDLVKESIKFKELVKFIKNFSIVTFDPLFSASHDLAAKVFNEILFDFNDNEYTLFSRRMKNSTVFPYLFKQGKDMPLLSKLLNKVKDETITPKQQELFEEYTRSIFRNTLADLSNESLRELTIDFVKTCTREYHNYFSTKKSHKSYYRLLWMFLMSLNKICKQKEITSRIIDDLYNLFEDATKYVYFLKPNATDFTKEYKMLIILFILIKKCCSTLLSAPENIPSQKYSYLLNCFVNTQSQGKNFESELDPEAVIAAVYKKVTNPRNKMVKKDDKKYEGILFIKLAHIFNFDDKLNNLEEFDMAMKPVVQLLYKIRTNLIESKQMTVAYEDIEEKPEPTLKQQYPVYKKQISDKIDLLVREGITLENTSDNIKQLSYYINDDITIDGLIKCISQIKELRTNAQKALSVTSRMIANRKTPFAIIYFLDRELSFNSLISPTMNILNSFGVITTDIIQIFINDAKNMINQVPKLNQIRVAFYVANIIMILNKLNATEAVFSLINQVLEKTFNCRSNDYETELIVVFIMIIQSMLMRNNIISPTKEDLLQQEKILNSYFSLSYNVATAICIGGHTTPIESIPESTLLKLITSETNDFHSLLTFYYEYLIRSTNEKFCESVYDFLLTLIGSVFSGTSTAVLANYIPFQMISHSQGQHNCKTPQMLLAIAYYSVELFRRLLKTDKKDSIRNIFAKLIIDKSKSAASIKKKIAIFVILSNSYETKRAHCLMKLNNNKDFYYIDRVDNFSIDAYKLPFAWDSLPENFSFNTTASFISLNQFTPALIDLFQVLVVPFSNVHEKNETFTDSLLKIYMMSCLRGYLSDPTSGDNYCAQLLSILDKEEFTNFEFIDYSNDVLKALRSLLKTSFDGIFAIPVTSLSFLPVSLTQITAQNEFKLSSTRIKTDNTSQLFITPIITKNSQLLVNVNRNTKSIFGILMFDINVNREIAVYYSSDNEKLFFNYTPLETRKKSSDEPIVFKFFPTIEQGYDNVKVELGKKKSTYIKLPDNSRCSFFVISPQHEEIFYKLDDENVTYANKKTFSFFSNSKTPNVSLVANSPPKNFNLLEEINYDNDKDQEKFFSKMTYTDPSLITTCPSFKLGTAIKHIPSKSKYLTYSSDTDRVVELNRATGKISFVNKGDVTIDSTNECHQIHYKTIPNMPTEIINVFLSGISDAFRNEIITLTISKLVSSKITPVLMPLQVFKLSERRIITLITKMLLFIEPMRKNNLRDQKSPIDFFKVNSLSEDFVIANETMYDHYIGMKNLIEYIKDEKRIKTFMKTWFNEIIAKMNTPNMHFVKQSNPYLKVMPASSLFLPYSTFFLFPTKFNKPDPPFSGDFAFPNSKVKANYAYHDERSSLNPCISSSENVAVLWYNFKSNEPLFDTVFELVVSIKYFIIMLKDNFSKLDDKWIFSALFKLVKVISNAVIGYSPFFYSHWQDIFDFLFSNISFCQSDIPKKFLDSFKELIKRSDTITLRNFHQFLVNQKETCFNDVSKKYLPLYSIFGDGPSSEKERNRTISGYTHMKAMIGLIVRDTTPLNNIKRVLSPYASVRCFPFHLLMTDWAYSFSKYPPSEITIVDDNIIKVEFTTSYIPESVMLCLPKSASFSEMVSIGSNENTFRSRKVQYNEFSPPGKTFYVKFGDKDDIKNVPIGIASSKPIGSENDTRIITTYTKEFEEDIRIFMNEFTEKDDQIILTVFGLETFEKDEIVLDFPFTSLPEKTVFSKPKETHMIDLRTRVLIAFNWMIKKNRLLESNAIPAVMQRYVSIFTSVQQLMEYVKQSNSSSRGDVFIDRAAAMAVREGTSKDLNDSMIAQFARQYNDPEEFRNEEKPFHVKFKGESGIDAGGLSREFTTELVKDIMNKNIGIFVETPNGRNKHGLYRECIVPYYSALLSSSNTMEEEKSTGFSDIKQVYRSVGGLIAISVRSRMVQPFEFPPLFWKYLCYGDISIQDIYAIDEQYATYIKSLEEGIRTLSKTDFAKTFPVIDNTVINMRGEKIILAQIPSTVTKVTCQRYITACNSYRISEIKEPMEYIREGFLTGLNLVGLPYFVTPEVLEYVSCGEKLISISKLKSLTKFEEDEISEEMQKMFWFSLNKMSEEQKRKFLQFATGTTSIPVNAEFPFLKVDHLDDSIKDKSLPTASTCFYTLHLPTFTKANILHEKLCQAIEYCFSFGNK